MKNLFSALVLTSTTFFVHAQDTTPAQSYYKHDLGFNTNFVFQGFLKRQQHALLRDVQDIYVGEEGKPVWIQYLRRCEQE